MRGLDLSTVIRVVIVWHVEGLVDLGKGSEANGFGEEEIGLDIGQVGTRVLGVDDLWGKG